MLSSQSEGEGLILWILMDPGSLDVLTIHFSSLLIHCFIFSKLITLCCLIFQWHYFQLVLSYLVHPYRFRFLTPSSLISATATATCSEIFHYHCFLLDFFPPCTSAIVLLLLGTEIFIREISFFRNAADNLVSSLPTEVGDMSVAKL